MVLVVTSCVGEVILTEIVISGFQLMTNFYLIFDRILMDLIFHFFSFMVLFQDNP